MKIEKTTTLFQKRKGISTIVGIIIFSIFLTALFPALALSLQSETEIIEIENAVANQQNLIQHEDFMISNVCISELDNQLFVDVRNLGSNHIEFADLWIVDKSLSTAPATLYEINFEDSLVPFGSNASLLSSQPTYLTTGLYDIKVVTTLGTIQTFTNLEVNGDNESIC